MGKKLALGKGIASLIQEAPNELLRKSLNNTEGENTSVNYQPMMIDISTVITNSAQPRKIFKESELKELSNSIKENGVIQPIIVAKSEVGYELIAGERRLRASKEAGLTQVPAIIKKATDREKVIMSIIENVQRSDLNCIEEGLAYYKLMTDYNLTQEEVGKKLGKERSTVANYLRILKLPRSVIDLLQKEELTFGHAKVLAACEDREHVIRLANQAMLERLSVRELEKKIKIKNINNKNDNNHPEREEKYLQLQDKLEQKTGFKFKLNSKKKGNGTIVMSFSNEAEFNDLYDYLMNN